MRTRIENADWVVAWDSQRGAHVYLRHADVVFNDQFIEYVGTPRTIGADNHVDGQGLMVIPGLINLHCHPSIQPFYRGFTEEFGNPRLFNSGRDEFRQVFSVGEDAQRISAEFALAEMIAGGVTTIVDLSHPYSRWLDILARSGVRACVAPMYRSARWYAESGQETLYEWDERQGWLGFEEAKSILDDADHHACGRLFSMVAPAQVDTCTADLLRESARFAQETARPLHVHASQSYAEFQGMTRRHDMTPIEWLDTLGFLTEQTIIGHAVFSDEHPWLHWPTRRDLSLLVEAKTSIAHCPTPFARDGTLLFDIGRYANRGINIGIGTDTHPHNLIEEMRWAEILGRVASGPRHTFDTGKLFDCVTVNAARALGRDDIGRIETGAKADIVTVDLGHPSMNPCRDPLRSLIYSAADRAIHSVYIDGRCVFENGVVHTIDRPTVSRRMASAQERTLQEMNSKGSGKRKIDTIVPLSLPLGNRE